MNDLGSNCWLKKQMGQYNQQESAGSVRFESVPACHGLALTVGFFGFVAPVPLVLVPSVPVPLAPVRCLR